MNVERAIALNSLDVDCAVIAEDAEHLVLSIRIRKATIADNHAVLASVSDICARTGRIASRVPRTLQIIALILMSPGAMAANWVLTIPSVAKYLNLAF